MSAAATSAFAGAPTSSTNRGPLAELVRERFPRKWADVAARVDRIVVVEDGPPHPLRAELWNDIERAGAPSRVAFVFRLGDYLIFGPPVASRLDPCPRCIGWSLALERRDIVALEPREERPLPHWPNANELDLLGDAALCIDPAGKVLRFPSLHKHPACDHGALPPGRPPAVRGFASLVDARVGLVRRVWTLAEESSKPVKGFAARMSIAYADYVHPRLPRLKREQPLLNALGVDFESPDKARLRATFEAFERIALFSPPERGPVLVAPSNAIPSATEAFRAEDFWAYAPEQLVPGFPFRNPTNDEPLAWRAGVLASGAAVLAPEDFIVDQASCRRFHSLNSSGCAAHVSEEAAKQSALAELVERHCFLRHWAEGIVPRAIPKACLPDSLGGAVELLEAEGYRVHLADLSLLPGIRVAAVVLEHRDERRPKAVLAAGADPSMTAALWKALREIGSQLALRDELDLDRPAPAMTPESVKTPSQHARFFHAPENFAHLGSLVASRDPLTAAELGNDSATPSVAELGRGLASAGVDVAFFDIAPVALARAGVHVVRCVSPELLPIAFGTGRLRLGGPDRARPLAAPDFARSIPHPFP